MGGEDVPPCLPSLALLHGLVDKCGFNGEVLARAAPSYLGMIAAIFIGKDKGWKVINHPIPGIHM